MSVDRQSSGRALDAYIERYFAACPNAADTVEGVWAWWLPRDIQSPTLEEVADALERLVATGRLQRHVMFDERVVYSRVPSWSGGEA